MTKKLQQLPIYPVFAAIYPVLALLSFNLGQVKFKDGIRAMFFSALIAFALLLLMKLVYRNWHRAAFISAGLIFLFFTYGQVYDLIFARWKMPNFTALMLALWFFLMAAVLLVGALRKVRFETAALTLNIIMLGLLIYPIIQIVQGPIKKSVDVAKEPLFKSQETHVTKGQVLPDIYYIMPEDYGRVDLLQSGFHIDISLFMQHLKDMGFYVAECSQSNYSTSELSLGSSLNMEYLQNLDASFDPKIITQGPIWDSIRYSTVISNLKKTGYKTVAFATGFAWSELDNSDIYISPPPLTSGITNFESLLLRTTPIRHLEDVGIFNLDEIDGQQYRDRTMLEFNSMAGLARLPGPKFVFVHIINPHEPFVFGPDGSPIDPSPYIGEDRLYTLSAYTLGYQKQIPFVNKMLLESIQTLIAKSSVPPVILLQTDTAPLFTTGSDKFKILNAYYMPGGHTDQLYPTISPVNTFRLIFNTYLGTSYPLLDDVSYDSPIPYIYNFTKISNAPCKSQ
jgi:hypothetical protein